MVEQELLKIKSYKKYSVGLFAIYGLLWGVN